MKKKEIFFGYLDNLEFHGYGILCRKSSYFFGEFENGLKHGLGVTYKNSKKIEEGKYYKDDFVKNFNIIEKYL